MAWLYFDGEGAAQEIVRECYELGKPYVTETELRDYDVGDERWSTCWQYAAYSFLDTVLEQTEGKEHVCPLFSVVRYYRAVIRRLADRTVFQEDIKAWHNEEDLLAHWDNGDIPTLLAPFIIRLEEYIHYGYVDDPDEPNELYRVGYSIMTLSNWLINRVTYHPEKDDETSADYDPDGITDSGFVPANAPYGTLEFRSKTEAVAWLRERFDARGKEKA